MRLVFPGSKPVPKRHPPNMLHGKKVCVSSPGETPGMSWGNLESAALLSALHGTSDVLNLPHLA